MKLPEHQPCPRCGVCQSEFDVEGGEHVCEQCSHVFDLRDIRHAELFKLWRNIPMRFFRARVYECEAYVAHFPPLPAGERWEIRIEGGGVK